MKDSLLDEVDELDLDCNRCDVAFNTFFIMNKSDFED